MLDALMKFGAHRVDYFDLRLNMNPKAFGFYIRAEIPAGEAYSREAKHQLYTGLAVIQAKLEMKNLSGIYLDVDSLDNLNRPAYLQMKSDMLNGSFRRLFVLDENALLGSALAEYDFRELYRQTGGFELFTCKYGDCVSADFFDR